MASSTWWFRNGRTWLRLMIWGKWKSTLPDESSTSPIWMFRWSTPANWSSQTALQKQQLWKKNSSRKRWKNPNLGLIGGLRLRHCLSLRHQHLRRHRHHHPLRWHRSPVISRQSPRSLIRTSLLCSRWTVTRAATNWDILSFGRCEAIHHCRSVRNSLQPVAYPSVVYGCWFILSPVHSLHSSSDEVSNTVSTISLLSLSPPQWLPLFLLVPVRCSTGEYANQPNARFVHHLVRPGSVGRWNRVPGKTTGEKSNPARVIAERQGHFRSRWWTNNDPGGHSVLGGSLILHAPLEPADYLSAEAPASENGESVNGARSGSTGKNIHEKHSQLHDRTHSTLSIDCFPFLSEGERFRIKSTIESINSL